VIGHFVAEVRARKKECRTDSSRDSGWRETIPERPPIELPIPFSNSKPSTVRDVWSLLHKARVDTPPQSGRIEPEVLARGWAKLEEIRGDEQFRKCGQAAVAYLKGPGSQRVLLATAADRIR